MNDILSVSEYSLSSYILMGSEDTQTLMSITEPFALRGFRT